MIRRRRRVLGVWLTLSSLVVTLAWTGGVPALGRPAGGEVGVRGGEWTELRNVELELMGDETAATRDVAVRGRAIFRPVTEVVATGPAGDATVEDIGADLVSATVAGPMSGTVSFPSAPSDELVFSFEVADPPPPPATGVPEVVTYAWRFEKPEGQRRVFRLEASVSSQYHEPGSPDPVGMLVECQVMGNSATCPAIGPPIGGVVLGPGDVQRVPAEIVDRRVQLRPTLAQLGVQPGGAIVTYDTQCSLGGLFATTCRAISTNLAVPSSAAAAQITTAGRTTIDALDVGLWPGRVYHLPVEQVRLGAGTTTASAQDILAGAVSVKLQPDGRFDHVIRGLEAGSSYRVAAEACYGETSCATWTAVIDVPGEQVPRQAPLPEVPEPELPEPGLARYGGADRFKTAAALSAASFEPGVDAVYVATGADFPDALTGAVVAAVEEAPVLLVSSGGIPAATAAELERLQPGRIVLLGGPGVIGAPVEQALAAYTAGAVERRWGADRFSTAVAVSQTAFPAGADVVYVATGSGFPDALAGVPGAASAPGPLLLVAGSGIPAATAAELDRLAPRRIVVLGGRAAVGDGAAHALGGYAQTVERVHGGDRFATAAAVAAAAFPDPATVHTVFVATGGAFPDALAAGAVAGAGGAPLLLTLPDRLPDATAAELARLAPRRIVVMGGVSAVSAAVEARLAASTRG